ncbi:hypothetical protein MOUN0_N02982 [Monosporozyma unispora]
MAILLLLRYTFQRFVYFRLWFLVVLFIYQNELFSCMLLIVNLSSKILTLKSHH